MTSGKRWVFAVAATLFCVGTAASQPPGRPGQGGAGNPDRALAGLQLTGAQKEKAQGLVDASDEATRKLIEQARADLLGKMKEVLSEGQLRRFRNGLEGRGEFGGGRSVSTDDLVERVLVFDKNKTGKVAREDLPERMQHLVDMGDSNKDGALDREELKKLTAKLNTPRNLNATRALEDLELTGATKDKAKQVVDAAQEATRKQLNQTRTELLAQLKDVLSEEQLKQFKDALERRPGGPFGRGRGPGNP